jgi:ssDNA-binding Zn-finger/Zn-ribbon topoisomerase 1
MEATLQSIFRKSFSRYQKRHGISHDQYQAANAIMNCQRAELGQETWLCPQDGHLEHQPHSCRHRSCPRCHGSETQRWLDKTQARLLPCDHYHVVFTLPHELNEVWQFNRQWSADHLFKASAETLRQLLKDERYLGAEVGLLASLHTWGRTASFHPHVHVLVTGGGLQGDAWRPVEKDFLLPVGVLKAKFRGKWLSWLNTAYSQGKLKLPSHWRHGDWQRALRQVARKSWNVRIQGPYRHGDGVVNYLSRYLHGGPIKDHRLTEADANKVSFRYRDHHDGKEKTMTLKTEHFISRVLWHVPVKGQHNLRYYGLYVPVAHAKRDSIRAQLQAPVGEAVQPTEKPEHTCPDCGAMMWHYYSTRRQNSYIKSSCPPESAEAAQQAVQLNRGIEQWTPP